MSPPSQSDGTLPQLASGSKARISRAFFYWRTAIPTDANGVFSLVPGYLATDGATIQASQHNPPLEDIASAMTGRLPRNGNAAMTGPLKLGDGSSSAPALTLASNTTAGLYKNSSGTLSMTGIFGAVPVGAIMDFAGTAAPPGWMFCYGQTLQNASYPDLFAAIGGTYGAFGSTFNLPDLRCMVTAGADQGAIRGLLSGSNVLGALLGSQTATVSIAQLPSITPAGTISAITPAGTVATAIVNGTNVINFGTGSGANLSGGGGADNIATITANSTFTGTPVTPTFTGTPIGSGQGHANVQPTLVLNKIIFTGVA